ncbi:hypothetical protein BYT27DRAFT_6678863 [Phlegmacium glaucopus]|nr:hypothetical protein BYT27DRAFT_6678863 [Phlegmacium glaucopus]
MVGTLGYSAFVGLGIFIIGFLMQVALILIVIKQQKKGVQITEKQVRLTMEVLQGICLIKM